MTAEKSKRAAYTLEYKLEADGKVDQNNPTQFGRALRHPGIEMIAVYSPEAREQSERAFSSHQERLPNELALAGITDRAAANRYLREIHMPAVNAKFACPAQEQGTAFVPWIGGNLAVFHGPRKLADYNREGKRLSQALKRAA